MSRRDVCSRTWRVGLYTARLIVPQGLEGLAHAVVEWEPTMPQRLSPVQMRQYTTGRDRALAELAADLVGTSEGAVTR